MCYNLNVKTEGFLKEGKKNEETEFKTEMTDDKAAKIVAKEISNKAKLNKADILLKLKNNSLEQLKKILKRVM